MEMSNEINEIAAALAKAQAGLGKLIASKTGKVEGESKKTGKRYEYSYTYANLADALEACRATLNAEGIAVIQLPATPKGNGIEVTTMLAHSSGQWLRSDPLFMPVSGGAQDVGSAITYGRRYQLLAMVGLAPEDDDGAAAQAAKPESWGERRQGSKPKRDAVGPRCRGKAAPKAAKFEEIATEIANFEGCAVSEVKIKLWDRCRIDLQPYLDADGQAPERDSDIGVRDADAMIKEAGHWLRELQGA